MAGSGNSAGSKEQPFGGVWTEQKLEVVAAYLQAYVTAMKRLSFHLTYIDAFAGSGRWRPKGDTDPSLFDADESAAQRAFRDGSARRALRVDPPFDRYVLIERDASKVAELKRLHGEFSRLAERIDVR